MALQLVHETYLSAKEVVEHLPISLGHFHNLRSAEGDHFIVGHADVIPGRIFFRLSDVLRLQEERPWKN